MFFLLIWPMVAATAASAAAGLLGGERRNRVDQREAQKNRDFQAGQAGLQMEFQERMRNTGWQAAVADMEAAGINPAVAYSQGPAMAPAGARGSGAQPGPAENTVSSAFQAAQMDKSLKLMDKQVEKTDAEAKGAKADAAVSKTKADYWATGMKGEINGRKFERPPRLYQLMDAELATARAGATNMSALSDRNRQLARIAKPMGDLSEDMGKLLPILTGVMGAAGPGSKLIRALRKVRR